jgi:hypothetical protein
MTLLNTIQEHPYLGGLIRDYVNEVIPFIKRVRPIYMIPGMLALKTLEFSIYRFWGK